MFLRRAQSAVYSTTVVDEAALAAFRRDGVIQVKGIVDAKCIEEVRVHGEGVA